MAPPLPVSRLKKPPPPDGRAFQLRLTRNRPPTEPCFDRETDGADFVRVNLFSETPGPCSGPGCPGNCCPGNCEVMDRPFCGEAVTATQVPIGRAGPGGKFRSAGRRDTA